MNNPNDYQSMPPKRQRTVKAALTHAPRTGRLRPISAIAGPLIKRLVIRAYCRGWIDIDTVRAVFRAVDLRGGGRD